MTRIHRLDAGPGTVQWGYVGGAGEAVLELDSGDTLVLRSVSGSPDDPVPAGWIPETLRRIHEQVLDRGPGVHILTGPVAVRGAVPGDTLAVHIERVRIDAPYGFNYIGPMSGLLFNEYDEPDVAILTYDEERRYASYGRMRIKTAPFFGIMGVAPPLAWGRQSSIVPGRFGGNMDNRQLTPGTTLYLPVMREGAHFYAGDGHGAQGDGEIDVTAIETSLEGEFRLELLRGTDQQWPYARRGSLLISMGFDESLQAALTMAARQMIGLLETEHGLSAKEAYRLCSIAADYHITQAVNGVKGVHGMLDTAILI
ncbi:acetamidase/formamidase family protein [Paenibacillus sp. IB182496]|uniref:Acetamidase/formamidase family protein n=1 Tax=Paenibacillus sabuli TaxID=2772509 RepID=A0A927BPI2_9BACL|nr:acetamidase/formamidase family protein [Paenibacillus sabuli]MBD2844347.1 acetamidase/formamidase family protein [Paenibacillus sabuli]